MTSPPEWIELLRFYPATTGFNSQSEVVAEAFFQQMYTNSISIN